MGIICKIFMIVFLVMVGIVGYFGIIICFESLLFEDDFLWCLKSFCKYNWYNNVLM